MRSSKKASIVLWIIVLILIAFIAFGGSAWFIAKGKETVAKFEPFEKVPRLNLTRPQDYTVGIRFCPGPDYTLCVNVKKNETSVSNFGIHEFQVLEDGVSRSIRDFQKNENLHALFLVDASSHMSGKLQQAKDDVNLFASQMTNKSVYAAVYSFRDEISKDPKRVEIYSSNFTEKGDAGALRDQVAGRIPDAQQRSYLWDALIVAAADLEATKNMTKEAEGYKDARVLVLLVSGHVDGTALIKSADLSTRPPKYTYYIPREAMNRAIEEFKDRDISIYVLDKFGKTCRDLPFKDFVDGVEAEGVSVTCASELDLDANGLFKEVFRDFNEMKLRYYVPSAQKCGNHTISVRVTHEGLWGRGEEKTCYNTIVTGKKGSWKLCSCEKYK